MALTAKQRRALPDSAFVYPSTRKYPVPTKAQARKAGISERQRLAIHRNALARAGQSGTSGSYSKVGPVVRRRSSGKVQSVKRGAKGGASRPSSKVKRRRPPTVLKRRRRR
jgi:hypothetical protein